MTGPRLVHALVAHTDGRLSEQQIRDDLSTLQDRVGGSVEYVALTPTAGLYCNETGALDGLPHNAVASRAAGQLRPDLAPALDECGLRGDVVFLGITSAGNNRDCPRAIADVVRKAAAALRGGAQ